MKRLRIIVAAGCVIAVAAVVPTHPGLAAPPVQAQSVAATSTMAVITTIPVGATPFGVAVNQGDDTVYVTNRGSDNVSVINGRLCVLTDDTITVGDGPIGVAVDQGDDTVYVTNYFSGTVSVINGRTGTVDDTITVGNNPRGVAVDGSGTNAGLVYVTNSDDSTVSVIARVSASLC